MGILSFVGWLFSGATKFIPGVPMVAVYGLAALAVVGLPAGYGYHKGSEGKSAAVAAEKASCRRMAAENKATTALAIAEILSTVDESSDHSENVVQYCKRNPGLCRSEGEQ